MKKLHFVQMVLLALVGGYLLNLYLMIIRSRDKTGALTIKDDNCLDLSHCPNDLLPKTLFIAKEKSLAQTHYATFRMQKACFDNHKASLLAVLKQKIQAASSYATAEEQERLINLVQLAGATSNIANRVIKLALQDADFSLAAEKAPDTSSIATYTIDRDTIYINMRIVDNLVGRRLITEEFIHRFYARRYFSISPKKAIPIEFSTPEFIKSQELNPIWPSPYPFNTPATEDAFIKGLNPNPIWRSPYPFNNQAEFKQVGQAIKSGEARIQALIGITQKPLAELTEEQRKLRQAAEYYQPQPRTLSWKPCWQLVPGKAVDLAGVFKLHVTQTDVKFFFSCRQRGYFAPNILDPKNRVEALINDYMWERLQFSYSYNKGIGQELMEKHAHYCSQDNKFIQVFFPELYAYTMAQLQAYPAKPQQEQEQNSLKLNALL